MSRTLDRVNVEILIWRTAPARSMGPCLGNTITGMAATTSSTAPLAQTLTGGTGADAFVLDNTAYADALGGSSIASLITIRPKATRSTSPRCSQPVLPPASQSHPWCAWSKIRAAHSPPAGRQRQRGKWPAFVTIAARWGSPPSWCKCDPRPIATWRDDNWPRGRRRRRR